MTERTKPADTTEENDESGKDGAQQIVDFGSALTKTPHGSVYCMTIIGQIEGHNTAASGAKTTKYEHVLPLLAKLEESDEVNGVLFLLNTVGGVILPGPQLSLSALVKNTAQLPQIDLAAKAPASILGKSTSSCLQNGFVLGTASLLDGLAERFCAELGPQTAFYATGNLPIPIREACCTPILYRETLITDGLYRIWMKNKKG